MSTNDETITVTCPLEDGDFAGCGRNFTVKADDSFATCPSCRYTRRAAPTIVEDWTLHYPVDKGWPMREMAQALGELGVRGRALAPTPSDTSLQVPLDAGPVLEVAPTSDGFELSVRGGQTDRRTPADILHAPALTREALARVAEQFAVRAAILGGDVAQNVDTALVDVVVDNAGPLVVTLTRLRLVVAITRHDDGRLELASGRIAPWSSRAETALTHEHAAADILDILGRWDVTEDDVEVAIRQILGNARRHHVYLALAAVGR